MSKFKVGDTVQAKKPPFGNHWVDGLKLNTNYVVIKIPHFGSYCTLLNGSKSDSSYLNLVKIPNYPTTVGIEYTFEASDAQGEALVNLGKKLGFNNAYQDFGSFEVPSPVQKNQKEVVQFYQQLLDLKEAASLTTHKPGHMSGGGHIHLGLQRLPKIYRMKFVRNFLVDFTNRPYLTWIFNEWCDDINARSFASEPLEMSSSPSLDLHRLNHYNNYVHNTGIMKNFGMLYRNNLQTVECRFFDAPKTLKQTLDHVNFALAYFSYIKRLTKSGEKIKLKVWNPNDIGKFTYEKSIKEFKELLITLKLDFNDYKGYIKNYKDRIKHGRLN